MNKDIINFIFGFMIGSLSTWLIILLIMKKKFTNHDKCEVSLSGKQKKEMSSMTIKFSDMIHNNHELKEELKE